jgi:glycosyltransferase involved in cell wall biosynthesis
MALYLATSFLPAWKLCRIWQPDIIHAHFVVPTGALALALHLLTRIPYVLTAHLGDVPGGVPEQTDKLFKYLGPLIQPIWRHAAATTAVSGFVAGLAKKNCGINPDIILNGVPMIPPPPVLESNSPVRIVMLGRLSIQKNPLLALQALNLIKDLPWTLDVLGEGPLGDSMRQLAADYGMAERVFFRGWLDATEVTRRLSSSDILLMTSTTEGLPMAGIEALRHGLAIVGSRIGGLADVISDQLNGLFCDLNPESFASALQELIKNPQRLLDMRRASLLKAKDFSLPDRVNDYELLLERVLKG